MSFDRFVCIPVEKVTLIDVRLFPYCWLHLNDCLMVMDILWIVMEIEDAKIDNIPNLHITFS